MSVIKSFSVGDGDMFCIDHDSDNFTIIDCNYVDDEQRDECFNYIHELSSNKGIVRFISTHPDNDHIKGLEILDDLINIRNFYVVKNQAIKTNGETESFRRYCELRDDPNKAYYVYKDCSRRWMNRSSDKRKDSGINFIWPDTRNEYFIDALEKAKQGVKLNNISPIFTYTRPCGVKVMWMGDMERDFLEKIKDEVNWPEVDILFAPHHSRKSGHVIAEVLRKLNPQIIVIGEAPSKDLDYYNEYNTIKQNSAGDITFECEDGRVRIYVKKSDYDYPLEILYKEDLCSRQDAKYLGTLRTR